jgi:hypothetical protein
MSDGIHVGPPDSEADDYRCSCSSKFEYHSVRAPPSTTHSTPFGRVIDGSPAIQNLATCGKFARHLTTVSVVRFKSPKDREIKHHILPDEGDIRRYYVYYKITSDVKHLHNKWYGCCSAQQSPGSNPACK